MDSQLNPTHKPLFIKKNRIQIYWINGVIISKIKFAIRTK